MYDNKSRCERCQSTSEGGKREGTEEEKEEEEDEEFLGFSCSPASISYKLLTRLT